MNKLSVVISAFNEERKIADCLSSVKIADEIILIDNTSTDKTQEISRKFTNKIFTRSNNPMLNVNKNFGFTKAKNEWILSLDADEQIPHDLAEEIRSILKIKNNKINGYWIPRKNIIFGKWIEHTGWYPDYQLRLFKRGKGKFEEKHVHEMIKLDGESDYLKSPMLHNNYENINQFLQKTFFIYAPNEADNLIKNSYKFDWKDSIRFPVKEFLSRFFAREGYKDGLHGLVLSLLMAFYHLVIFVNIWQMERFKEIEGRDLLQETKNEFQKTNKELLFWFSKEQIGKIKNPIKRSIFRIYKKISR